MEQLDEGSGRNIIYAKILKGWWESDNYWNVVFGYGFAASKDFAGTFAHNDWLELLSNFGILGVLLYAIIFYTTGKQVFNRHWLQDKRLLMLVVVMSWFTVTLFSMGYTDQKNAFLRTIFIAYLVGNKNNSIV